MIVDVLIDFVVGALAGKNWGCLFVLIVGFLAVILLAIWASS